MSAIGQTKSHGISHFNVETGQVASNKSAPKVRASCGWSKPFRTFHAQLIHLKKYEKAEDQILRMIDSLGEKETWVFFTQVFCHAYKDQPIEESLLFKDINLDALNREFNVYHAINERN